jgi:hypothetical protein
MRCVNGFVRELRIGCLLVFLAFGCDFFSTRVPEAPIPGLSRIASSSNQISLGSPSPFAKIDEESPRPTAAFTYDFFMDSTETTQGAYEALMGRNPVTDARFGRGPGHPVYNVSFYDAALFCNARSKREGRDTVYAYTGRKQDAGGRTYELGGLAIHYERRVPPAHRGGMGIRRAGRKYFHIPLG